MKLTILLIAAMMATGIVAQSNDTEIFDIDVEENPQSEATSSLSSFLGLSPTLLRIVAQAVLSQVDSEGFSVDNLTALKNSFSLENIRSDLSLVRRFLNLGMEIFRFLMQFVPRQIETKTEVPAVPTVVEKVAEVPVAEVQVPVVQEVSVQENVVPTVQQELGPTDNGYQKKFYELPDGGLSVDLLNESSGYKNTRKGNLEGTYEAIATIPLQNHLFDYRTGRLRDSYGSIVNH